MTKTKRWRLSAIEIEAILSAAGNIDPCMFDEMPNEKEGDRMKAAWETGQEKLRHMLLNRRAK